MSTSSSLRTAPFKKVDVFTAAPFQGNALAVVLDADGLAPTDMQRIAAWMNLSETAFVLQPTRAEADYRLRIFTPARELPFAGHPSVGTAHALLEAGRMATRPHFIQECAAGLLPGRIAGDGAGRRIFVRAPRADLREVAAEAVDAAATALGAAPVRRHAPRIADNGPVWLVCELESETVVRALAPDYAALARLCRGIGAIGVAVFGLAEGRDYTQAVRVFVPGDGIPEDPVTGSANAAIGAYLHATGQLDGASSYRASQGRELGRDGYVDVVVGHNGDVEIGGQSVTCADGTILLPQ